MNELTCTYVRTYPLQWRDNGELNQICRSQFTITTGQFCGSSLCPPCFCYDGCLPGYNGPQQPTTTSKKTREHQPTTPKRDELKVCKGEACKQLLFVPSTAERLVCAPKFSANVFFLNRYIHNQTTVSSGRIFTFNLCKLNQFLRHILEMAVILRRKNN